MPRRAARPGLPAPGPARERRAPLRPAHRRRRPAPTADWSSTRRTRAAWTRAPGGLGACGGGARRRPGPAHAVEPARLGQARRLAAAADALPARLPRRARRHAARRLRPRTACASAGWPPDAWSLRWLGRIADRIVVHSEVEVERLRGIIPGRTLRVIPHFVEQRELPLRPEAARARLGLADRRVVTLLGFVYGRKGHRYAVEAVPHLPDGRRHGLRRRPGGRAQLRARPGAGQGARSWAWATASASRATSPRRTWRPGSRPPTWPSCPSPTSRRPARCPRGSRPASPCWSATCPASASTSRALPGALRFFSPPEPLPLAAAIRDLLAGPLPDPDPAVQQLAAELSLERTVERYLAVAREALAARGPDDPGLARGRSAAEQVGLVRALPGQVEVRPAEVAVGRRLAVDRPPQVRGRR